MGLTYGVGEQKPTAGTNVGGDQFGAKALWSKSLDAMQTKTATGNSQQWLNDLRFVAEVNNAIVVAAPDQLTLDRVIAGFERPLQQAWQQIRYRLQRSTAWRHMSGTSMTTATPE